MLDIWFGLDASGFNRAANFHPVFGPFLMVTYACLSNTLLLTVLVSILSNTFATINEDAAAEALFRKAVSTIEGVKADSLFSYQPPVNLVALCVMLPASYLLSPRWFHKVNVLMIRITSFPILLSIALYERQSKKSGTTTFYDTMSSVAERVVDTLPRQLKRMTFFEGLVGPDADITAIFEIEEEFESALDLDDGSQSDTQWRRRASLVSRPQAEPYAGKGASPSTSPNAIPTPRTRLGSAGKHAPEAMHSFTSPLAQVFQPLVVDDGLPENTNTPPGPSISYGPASRRRVSSLQSVQRRHPESLTTQAQVNAMKKFTQRSTPVEQSILSEGPDQHSHDDLLKTEAKIPLDSHEREPSDWERRLEEMEKRQERIETLLVQIAEDVRNFREPMDSIL